jgi:hypothetical protein
MNNLKQLAIELSSFNTYVHLKLIQKAIVSCLYYIISVKSNTFAAQIAVTGVVFFISTLLTSGVTIIKYHKAQNHLNNHCGYCFSKLINNTINYNQFATGQHLCRCMCVCLWWLVSQLSIFCWNWHATVSYIASVRVCVYGQFRSLDVGDDLIN